MEGFEGMQGKEVGMLSAEGYGAGALSWKNNPKKVREVANIMKEFVRGTKEERERLAQIIIKRIECAS